ncbi:DUF4326 domain-containing protein [Oceanicaulis alexandrii]|uniref:DUF4326 domain-containing protein n=1 Tax=Oceanicaulis alexandrii TaxID=153233 RepID=UPI0035CF29DE
MTRWTRKHFIRPYDLAIEQAHAMVDHGLGAVSFDGPDDAPVWTPVPTLEGQDDNPVRLKLCRTKGFSLQAASLALNGRAARAVTRPGPFGNVFSDPDGTACGYLIRNKRKIWVWCKDEARLERHALLVEAFASWTYKSEGGPAFTDRVRAELPGLNLACFCPSHLPCHADVLLAIANGRDIKTALPWRTA